MSPRHAVLAVALLVACSVAAAPAVGADVNTDATHTTTETNATLLEAYPNPVARDDPGEFVAVEFSAPTNTTGWTLTDGKTTARLPNRTLEGTVAFSTTPEQARTHTDHPVSELDGRLLLADGGDELELRHDGEPVDTARYHDAPESSIRDFEAAAWRPVGATDFDPAETGGGEATVFALPDGGDRTQATLRNATDRLLLAGYTLTSERVTEALLAAHERGVTVRVLLDGSPVGGISERQARNLERLSDAGVDIRLLDGPHTRYRYHHAKYAVVDSRALVLTENFKPAGTGGMSSRGWGVVLDDREAAEALADLHASDRTWRAATPWETYREGREFVAPDPALGEFRSRHPPQRVTVDAATVLVAPDNAADALEAELEAAEDRILVQQVEIGNRDHRLLRAVLRAADRGVTVRVHLSGAWYVADGNADLVAWLNRRADAEGWDLEARVDDPDGYEKIHTKGVIVDETVVLGSLNWANSAAGENREVLVALEGASAAAYYAGVFEDDWSEGESRQVPVGLLGAVAVGLSGVLLVARRIEFVGREGVLTEWQW